MKKIIAMLVIIMFLLPMSLAKVDESCAKGKDCCTNDKCGIDCLEKCFAGKCQKIQPESSSSFYLAKDKEMFGIKSKYDGRGFGIVLPAKLKRNVSLHLNYPLLRKAKLVIENTKEPTAINKYKAVHIKKIGTLAYKKFDDKESYEVLSSIGNLNHIELTFSIKDKVLNGKEPNFIFQDEKGSIQYLSIAQKNKNSYTVAIDRPGTITVSTVR